jgi:DNA-3-methyladenine glycosylase
VYLNYGLHALVNAVTEASGSPAAILIRALEPCEGIDLMRARRQGTSRLGARGSGLGEKRSRAVIDDDRLCRGPGNLTVAMGIGLGDNMLDLTRSHLRIEDRGIVPPALSYSSRIGIRVGTDKRWRCSWKGHKGLSGR